MPRGNPDNLRTAAQRKRTQATERAESALAELVARRQPITFRGVARAAGVSVDFLYNSPLRTRIEQLRATAPTTPAGVDLERAAAGDSHVVRALAAQLRELKRRHHEEITELRAALAAAQGENLQLRRALGPTAARQAAAVAAQASFRFGGYLDPAWWPARAVDRVSSEAGEASGSAKPRRQSLGARRPL